MLNERVNPENTFYSIKRFIGRKSRTSEELRVYKIQKRKMIEILLKKEFTLRKYQHKLLDSHYKNYGIASS